MNPMWLMRMKQWVRHPPSKQRVMLVGAAIAFCVAIYAAELRHRLLIFAKANHDARFGEHRWVTFLHALQQPQ